MSAAAVAPASSLEAFSSMPPPPTTAKTHAVAVPNGLKQRRTSMALPSSPRLVEASAWTFRDDTGIEQAAPLNLLKSEDGGRSPLSMSMSAADKKSRKKWSQEETQMLVDGCNIHGVGNWKSILNDPNLRFDNRSPVDLKDRFRTYFPDAYRLHYPNARTHLSSRVRSTLPDGSPLFEKTRSKKRRPFTEEEDKALREGYEKHGCLWAIIVKDPVFKAMGRRSTDLRDRFRNAFPEEYERAGYKPRPPSKKRNVSSNTGASTPVSPTPSLTMSDVVTSSSSPTTMRLPLRAATDDSLVGSSKPSTHLAHLKRRKRAHTSQGLFGALDTFSGSKSVPQSNVCSDNESDAEDANDQFVFKRPFTPAARIRSPPGKTDDMHVESFMSDAPSSSTVNTTSTSTSTADLPQSPPLQHQQWLTSSSGIDTPTHSHHAWTPGSPYSPHSNIHSNAQSPFLPSATMIGKSAWGANDWFSANPRLDSSGSSISSASASSHSILPHHGEMSPPSSSVSPFSLAASLGAGQTQSEYGGGGGNGGGYGVMDRYDLFPAPHAHNPYGMHPHAHAHAYHHEYLSDFGVGDTFSDSDFNSADNAAAGGGGMRGFTHHSNYAGDLIFGARTHQPVQAFDAWGQFGFSGTGPGQSQGLGLTGMHGNPGVGVGLTGIEDIELAGISLEDPLPGPLDEDTDMEDVQAAGDTSSSQAQHSSVVDSSAGGVANSTNEMPDLNLEDLVSLPADDADAEAHNLTPPGTPHQSPPPAMRTARHASFQHPSPFSNASLSAHGRSVSVPPSEARQAHTPVVRPAIIDSQSQPELTRSGRASQPFFSADAHRTPSPPFFSSASGYGPLTESATSSQVEANSMNGDGTNSTEIPFLDLHYHWQPAGSGQVDMGPQTYYRQGLALDLAGATTHSFSSAGAQLSNLNNTVNPLEAFPPAWRFAAASGSGSPMPPPPAPPPAPPPPPMPRQQQQQRPMSMQALGKVGGVQQQRQLGQGRPTTLHMRGQSQGALQLPSSPGNGSVNPRELMMQSSSTGSEYVVGRKRASWDGRA